MSSFIWVVIFQVEFWLHIRAEKRITLRGEHYYTCNLWRLDCQRWSKTGIIFLPLRNNWPEMGQNLIKYLTTPTPKCWHEEVKFDFSSNSICLLKFMIASFLKLYFYTPLIFWTCERNPTIFDHRVPQISSCLYTHKIAVVKLNKRLKVHEWVVWFIM